MFSIFQQKNREIFDVRNAIANLVESYYRLKERPGKIWNEFSTRAERLGLDPERREEDLLKEFTQDIQRSYATLVSGKFVAFSYQALNGNSKSYLAMIVGTKRGNGVYYNANTKNTLMSCFLVTSTTNLNTLALVADVLRDRVMSNSNKTFSALTKDRNPVGYGPFNNVEERSGVSKDGLKALFPTNEFRTFRLETGMKNMYEVTI